MNKVAWIRLLLNEEITLRRPRLQVPLQAAVLPNGIQNLRAFRLHNRTAAANPDFAAPESLCLSRLSAVAGRGPDPSNTSRRFQANGSCDVVSVNRLLSNW